MTRRSPTRGADAPPVELAMTATSFRTEYQLGSRGYRYVLRKHGRLIADTGWHTRFGDAAAAYAREFLLVAAAATARYTAPDDEEQP